MGFFESIGFWLAKAITEFLIGVSFVVVFVIFLLWQERKTKKWQKERNEQRKASEKVPAKGTQSS